jgi:hypothetical protein
MEKFKSYFGKDNKSKKKETIRFPTTNTIKNIIFYAVFHQKQ